MEARNRVESMEKIFNHQIGLMTSLSNLLAEVEASQSDAEKLLSYYQSQTYMDDLSLEEDGYFDGMPRGVLSEDGVYNLIFERSNIAESLRHLSGILEK